MSEHAAEVARGERFEFGENWKRFLDVLDDERIATAVDSLTSMLKVASLEGKRFLDAGSGSGLFSLAARKLGASVVSFDFDPQSVACTRELRRRYFPDDPRWTVEAGSVLDSEYLRKLGQFDVVYSWGVLHHTGAMWKALENVVPLVAPGGLLFIAIYNDQGTASRRWTAIKRLYNRSPWLMKKVIVGGVGAYFIARAAAIRVGRLQNPVAVGEFKATKKNRGMSWTHDLVDWVGGYPFEVAEPEEIFRFYRDRGFELVELETVGGRVGCNQYVLRKISRPAPTS